MEWLDSSLAQTHGMQSIALHNANMFGSQHHIACPHLLVHDILQTRPWVLPVMTMLAPRLLMW